MSRHITTMNLRPDISVIILNYNGYGETVQLLESLMPFVRPNYEVFVADNGSSADEASLISLNYKNINVVKTGQNLGFAGGNNFVIDTSKGRYLLFLNNDTIIEDDSIDKMILFMDQNPLAGALSPRLHYDDPERTIQFAGYTKLSVFTLRNRCIGKGSKDTSPYLNACETAYLHGAAMMVRREVIEKVGAMDESFFLYYEEIDWSERIKAAGYQIWYFPQAFIIHKESTSIGNESSSKKYYMTRNRLLFALKHRKGLQRILSVFYLIFVASTVAILRAVLDSRPDQVAAIASGVRDFSRKKFGKWEQKF